jgi:hypothetical protein
MFTNELVPISKLIAILAALFATNLAYAYDNNELNLSGTVISEINLSTLIEKTNAVEANANLYYNTTKSLAAIITSLKTINSTYDHDYGSCARFNYFTIESITPISITINDTNAWFWSAIAKNGNYSENVISFVAFADENNKSLTIDSQWIKDNYSYIDKRYDYILNYRIMAISPGDAKRLLNGTLHKLKKGWNVSFANIKRPAAPTIFIKSSEYSNDNITLNIYSNLTENTTVEIYGELRFLNNSKGSAIDVRNPRFNRMITPGLNKVPLLAKGLLDGVIYLDVKRVGNGNIFKDKVFMTNGFWFVFSDSGSHVNMIDENCTKQGISQGLSMPGCVDITGTIYPGGYAGCAYNFNPRLGLSDISQYKALSFFAKGTGKYRVQIETESVTDYNYHYYNFTANNIWLQYIIVLTSFHQHDWGKKVDFTGKDVKNVVWLSTDGSDNQKLDLSIRDACFVNLSE